MSRPKLLDGFCGAGGAGKGYADAGFEVVGVDNKPQPHYPCRFVQADFFSYLAEHWREYDAFHASPPCQASTALTKGTNKGRRYVDVIPETRYALLGTGRPFVLENVQGAALRRDLTLCGEMFDLDVIRHRYFELHGFYALQPSHPAHRGRVAGWRHGKRYDGPYVAVYGDGGGKGSVAEWQRAMGIDWTDDRKAIAEAIPPAYTFHVGTQLLAHLEAVA